MAKNYYEIPVTRLKFNGLDGRIFNPLRSHKIQSVGQLIDALNNDELEYIRNIGTVAVNKIQKALVEGGYLRSHNKQEITDERYFNSLENLKSNINAFFEKAECDHAQMLEWQASQERAKNLILKFETFLDEIAYKYVDKNAIEEMHEEIQEYLYS